MKGLATQLLRALVPPQDALGAVPLARIRETTGLTSHQIRDAADSLIERGLVTRSMRGMLRLTTVGLRAAAAGAVITSGPNGPKAADLRSTFRARLWRAMRLRKNATLADLLHLAVNGQEKDPARDARKYLDALLRAKILGRWDDAAGMQHYLLFRDLGPKAPHWNKRLALVSDPNHGEVFHA